MMVTTGLPSNAQFIRFTNASCKPKLSNYFYMYRFQMNSDLFCAIRSLDIRLQHLNHSNMFVHRVYHLHVYYHMEIMLHHSGIPLPYDNRYNKVSYPFFERGCLKLCENYGIDSEETVITGG